MENGGTVGGQEEQPRRRDPSRRAFLRGAAIAGAIGAVSAGTASSAYARPPSGPSAHDSATVPPWPEARLGELSVIWRVRPGRRAVAITFDDGPDPRWTPHVLDMLGEAGARATFFCCGQAAMRHPDLVRRAAAQGEVGNHSWSHPDLANLSAERVDSEIDRAHRELSAIAGRPPTLFRPPYGNLRGPAMVAAARHGYKLVLWSDMVQRAHQTATADVQRLVSHLAPGQILLAHDGRGSRTGVLQRLPLLLRALHRAGYSVTTISDLLRAD
jgi:peptidoglycan/xylan/chitin deacetylase (PgdA/CDA1 family)